MSNGELYTILTNKAKKGKKGSIVAMVKGTNAKKIIPLIIKHISNRRRNLVKEITLDMAPSMNEIAKTCFKRSSLVIDRFHVQKLAYDAVQSVRIKYRWQAIEHENEAYLMAKNKGLSHKQELLSNGDTLKQLLARSRYLLYKNNYKWTESQQERATILFEKYPEIKTAYEISRKLGVIYEKTRDPAVARLKLARWFREIELTKSKQFSTVMYSFIRHTNTILNYFNNRSTNAAAESFNAKIKDFRRKFRGVRDLDFFLFRLSKIYA